jgi:hypothetical protein
MEKSTKDAAQQVNDHREDGEEAIKKTSKVMPIGDRTNKGTGSVNPEPLKPNRE